MKGTDRFRNLNRFVARKLLRDTSSRSSGETFAWKGKVLQWPHLLPCIRWTVCFCARGLGCVSMWEPEGLLADCLLLADVFENYRDCCLADYRLDPVHYYSSPHFTFDAFLLFSRAKLDFLTKVDQYLFLNKAMQGGLSMVAKHHSKANHPSLTDYNSSCPCRFLMFLDVNNLYGKAMMDCLPVGGFRWMSREELMVEFICGLPDEGEFGCFIDCTLVYPSALHDVHDDYPLAPMKWKVSYEDLSPHAKKMCDHHRLKHTLNKEKLLTTFEMKRHYVLHYRNLKLYSSLGLIISEVHRGLVFRQALVMRDYVQFNSLCHSQAQNDFDVDFYKLLSNSLFGKTIENPEKRTKVKLCRMKEELESNVGKPTFKRSKIIDQHLVGV